MALALPAPSVAVPAGAPAPALPQPLQRLDDCLNELGVSLMGRDVAALERSAESLQAALEEARLALASGGAVAPALRRHLALAVGRVAAQREALARASASVDRAIEVLLPGASGPAGLYGATGASERAQPGPGIHA